MPKDYVLALDQGTTSSRAILFRRDGLIAGIAQQEFTQHFPSPGRVEHDPQEILDSQFAVARRVLSEAGLSAAEVAAIGITNQRETTLLWERASGRPVANAIVWQDRRTADFCARLAASGAEPDITRKTGLVIDPYFAGSKLRWLLDEVDGARAAAERGELACGTVDSWLLWQLSGGRHHLTDATNASRTLLYDIHEGRWDPQLLELFGVPEGLLPEVRGSSEVYCECALEGLEGIPVAGVAGDQQAALFGQACFDNGMSKNTYGTGCFLLLHTGDEARTSEHRLLTTIASRIAGRTDYAFEGSIFSAGSAVQWLRDGLGLIETAADSEALAGSVDDSGGVTMVPAFTGLGAPHWDPSARATITGITRGTGAAHIARATLEAIALQSADLLEAMNADAAETVTEMRVDGGACANDLLMQLQADLAGLPVVRPQVTETTALGAAYLAGLATGFWRDRGEIAAQWQVDRRFEPQMPAAEVDAIKQRWRRSLERAKNWEPE